MEQVFKAAYRSYSPESFHFGEQLANPQCQALFYRALGLRVWGFRGLEFGGLGLL